jgi:hypothetical protein
VVVLGQRGMSVESRNAENYDHADERGRATVMQEHAVDRRDPQHSHILGDHRPSLDEPGRSTPAGFRPTGLT